MSPHEIVPILVILMKSIGIFQILMSRHEIFQILMSTREIFQILVSPNKIFQINGNDLSFDHSTSNANNLYNLRFSLLLASAVLWGMWIGCLGSRRARNKKVYPIPSYSSSNCLSSPTLDSTEESVAVRPSNSEPEGSRGGKDGAKLL